MTLDLAARRALLKDAQNGTNPDDFSAFVEACAGASEEERTALARTLPPSRLHRAEGPTGRAMYVLAALGKPAALVDFLDLGMPPSGEMLVARRDVVIPAVVEAGRERDEAWLLAVIDAVGGSRWTRPVTWPIALALVEALGRPAESLGWVRFVLGSGAFALDDFRERSSEEIVAWLAENPVIVERDFWDTFRVEGAGDSWVLVDQRQTAWPDAVRMLLADGAFREKLLDESLGGLLRDFSSRHVAWHIRAQRLADPTPDEIAARSASYLAVLGTAPSTAVGLAQDMLARAVPQLDPDALIRASSAVLVRTEKKLIKGQLGLLRTLMKARPECAAEVQSIIEPVIDSLPADLERLARELAPLAEVSHDQPGGDPVAIAPPPLRALPHTGGKQSGMLNDQELFELIGEQLEGTGDGADLPRILGTLAAREVTLPAALAQRVSEWFTDRKDPNETSPRIHLAQLLTLDAARRKSVLNPPRRTLFGLGKRRSEDWGMIFRGYRQRAPLVDGMPDPPGVEVQTHNYTSTTFSPGAEAKRTSGTFRTAFRMVPTHSPAALLVSQFRTPPIIEPLPPITRAWSAVMLNPGGGALNAEEHVVGIGPKPFWLPIGEPPLGADATLGEKALDLADVPAEFTFRVEEAREQDGYPQIVQWAAWLLQENPDTLAAHAHPPLWAAMHVVNVQGIEQLLTALGSTRQVPGPPTCSALALALSAKEASRRAAAAEAVAQLADAGLLDPTLLAAQLGAHLGEGHIIVGRVAESLSDAAGVSALSGYRVLQTLVALLPELVTVAKTAPLVEVTTRLATAYGTPVTLPEGLVKASTGRSALASALKALLAVPPRPTALAEEAAAQAGDGAP